MEVTLRSSGMEVTLRSYARGLPYDDAAAAAGESRTVSRPFPLRHTAHTRQTVRDARIVAILGSIAVATTWVGCTGLSRTVRTVCRSCSRAVMASLVALRRIG